MGLDCNLFLIDFSRLDKTGLPSFYVNVFKVWQTVSVEREGSVTGQSLLEEPLFFNPLFPIQFFQSGALCASFVRAGVTRLAHLIESGPPCWISAAQLARRLGWHSERLAEKMIHELKNSLSPKLKEALGEGIAGGLIREGTPFFPQFFLSPGLGEEEGGEGERIRKMEGVKNIALQEAEGKKLYKLHVKTVQSSHLKGTVDTKWRSHLQVAEERQPVWRVLYKLPLSKRAGDLQWRILHCAVSTGRFLHRVDPSISAECCFCGEEETVFHTFTDCVRLGSLFHLLQGLLQILGVIFSKDTFIFGFPYSFKNRDRCVLINFILGKAKLHI
ncbi:UNVERIFIED_CONTAM: hypothetical protein FKN15_056754 [Acipenser sinensis]